MRSTDVLVLGAGIAGASLAAELAAHRRTVLLEVEERPGRHATGRSAALYAENYGNSTVRALTRASRRFFEEPPAGFCDTPLLRPRGALHVADATCLGLLDELRSTSHAPSSLTRLSVDQAIERCPVLSSEWLAGAVYDDAVFDLDVAAFHQSCLRQARRAGAELVFGAGHATLRRTGSSWVVGSGAGDFAAQVIVNATGAWADEVARAAGVATIGLRALRRTCVLLPAPDEPGFAHWPMVIEAAETFYFKPQSGQLLLSPANEDESLPCDAAPDELDVAIAVDRFESATTCRVARIAHRWAGLRSFVADRSPVVGFDDAAEGFFWLAAQGGYGIQTAPALARIAVALLCDLSVPEDILAEGVDCASLARQRWNAPSGEANGTL